LTEMVALESTPGTVEQALYTWSKSNLSGGRGRGFTAVSPGLREEIDWLTGLDLSGIQDFEPDISESEGYAGWQQLVSTGTFVAGGLRVVYRKISSAGSDAVERNRSAVHMLLGRVEDLDLASVADDDLNWLTAEDCPLDRPPRLQSLSLDELRPRRADHECAVRDEEALLILRHLASSPYELRTEFDASTFEPTSFIANLLAAIPTRLWGGIQLDWRVGRDGPMARVGIVESNCCPPSAGRTEKVGLVSCDLHRKVDAALAGLPSSQRRWSSFAAIAMTIPPRKPPPVLHSVDPPGAWRPVGGSASERLKETIGMASAFPAGAATGPWQVSRPSGH
jgi:hypothetical protein